MAALRVLGHQVEGNIVRDRIALEAGGQSFLEGAMPLDDKRLSIEPYKNVSTELAFGGKDQGSHGLTRRQAAQIVAELSVEVTKTVRAGDAKACARAGKEKSPCPAKRTEAARFRRHNTSLAASEKEEPPLPFPPGRVRSVFPGLGF